MDKDRFNSKEKLCEELGISPKTLLLRVTRHEDENLREVYKKRMFSPAEVQYIKDRVLNQIDPPPLHHDQ